MNSIIRAAITYFVVWGFFRISGKHTFSEMTTFDFVLLLIISEATQQALIGVDNSMINSAIVVSTLIGLNILMSLLKQRSTWFDRTSSELARAPGGAEVVVLSGSADPGPDWRVVERDRGAVVWQRLTG